MTIPFILQVATMFILPLVAVIVPFFLGQRYGVYYRRRQQEISHVSLGSVVGAAFGLVAFMLAFTFQMAASRYAGRKALLMEEVKDIRTAYLRAGLIPEPYRSNTRKQLIEYVNLRANLRPDLSKIDSAIARSEEILDTLWNYTEELATLDRNSEVYALYTTTVNDLVNAYHERIVTVFVYRIPRAILTVLFIIGFISMLILGYQFGVSEKGNLWINVLLALLFAVVMFLIFGLDRPETGMVPVNQKPLLNLQKQLNERQSYEHIKVP